MGDIRVIKVFEDRQQKVSLSELEKKDILSLKKIIGENNVILQVDNKLLIRQYVGFVQINKTRLLIYPKIASRATGEDEYKKSFVVLLKLLAYSGFDSIKKTPAPLAMEKYEGDLLELFISLFVDELMLQFRRDINRGYNNRLENQTFIKGKVDFPETIKKNSYRAHLHYVRYDQFNEDVLLNSIFKTIIHKLINRTTVKDSRIKLNQSLLWLEEVESIQLNNEIWNQVKFTRHNTRYKPAFNLARLFYYNSSPNLNKGDEYTFSFLVPVNQLFEMYLYKVIKSISNNKTSVHYQKPVDYLAYYEDTKYLQLRPDITMIEDHKVKHIIDAKYKDMFSMHDNHQIQQSDLYQMLAYSVGYKCDNISLVYPRFLGDVKTNFLVKNLKIDNYGHEIMIDLLQIDLELTPEALADEFSKYLSKYNKGESIDENYFF